MATAVITKTNPANAATQVAVDTTFDGTVTNASFHQITFTIRYATSHVVVFTKTDSWPTGTHDFSYGESITLLQNVQYEWDCYDQTDGQVFGDGGTFTFTSYAEQTIEGIRLGFIDDVNHVNFPQFKVIKQDVADDPLTEVKEKSSSSGTSRIRVATEIDFISRSTLTTLKNSLLNSQRQLLFMKFPSGLDQFLDFRTITNPSSTNTVLTMYSNNSNLDYVGTEIGTSEYQQISEFPSGTYNEFQRAFGDYEGTSYGYIFFKMQPTFDCTNKIFQRLTLAIYQPSVYMGSTPSGFKIDVYDRITGTWLEIGRLDWTMAPYSVSTTSYDPNSHTFYASIRPTAGYTTMINYVDVTDSNSVYFRMRNTTPRPTGTNCYMGIGYTYLLVDGFPVTLTSATDFNFRDAFTGSGYTGKVEVQEI